MEATLPVELWIEIHALACSDDGSTGRALSLVCKEWCAISAPFKFRSVALCGAKPILRFSAVLEAVPETLRTVHSLFIGCQNLRLYQPAQLQMDLERERRRGLELLNPFELYSEDPCDVQLQSVTIDPQAIENSIIRILRRTANTLRTLHCYSGFGLDRSAPLYPVSLPCLETLVLNGPFQCPTPSPTVLLPNLRSLHLVPMPPMQHVSRVLLQTIGHAAPSLSCLVIPHAACSSDDLEQALEDTALRRLARVVVEVEVEVEANAAAPRRNSHPAHRATEDSGHAALARLAGNDARVRLAHRKPRWLDMQAMILDWERGASACLSDSAASAAAAD